MNPIRIGVLALILGFWTSSASALDLDWSGQFRAENHWLRNYNMDERVTPDATRTGAGGYYVPGGGSQSAHFQTLFLRLTPNVIVNDNVYIKSEWWAGDPVYGFFGAGAPYGSDKRQFYSTQSRGSIITAQRAWGEFVTDFGVVRVGRAPLHWGLGAFWNNGDGLWSRYPSTGDQIGVVSKFGSFSFAPRIIKYSMGNNIGGACVGGPTCTVTTGGGGVSDYSLALTYDNFEEDFEGGVNFIRRIAGAAQDPTYGYLGFNGSGSGMSFNVWDIYFRKKLGKFLFGAEMPVTNGSIGSAKYSTFAVAFEANWNISDRWEANLKAGRVPGQPGMGAAAAGPDKFQAFYFHPDYMRGLVMFNYRLTAFRGPNNDNNANNTDAAGATLSPFDNPLTNAKYLSWGGSLKASKWKFNLGFIWATAVESAQNGERFYNSWTRTYSATAAGKSQQKSLGWEWDLGTRFQWDENLQFGLDFGWFYPGEYFRFSNTSTDNSLSPVFASVIKVGVQF